MQIITVTRSRPAAFDQLRKFVKAQDLQDYEWLIVCDEGADDYHFPVTKGTARVKVVRRDTGEDTLPSFNANWLAALDHVTDDKVVVLEDDDWYNRSYLTDMNKMLDQADLAGFDHNAYYYVLERKAQRRHNGGMSALATTGFRRSLVPQVRKLLESGSVHLDILLWREFTGRKLLVDNFTGIDSASGIQPKIDEDTGNIVGEHPRHVGLKQPWHGGAAGLTQGGSHGGLDQTGKILRSWLGDDAAFYLKFTREHDPKNPQGFVLFAMPSEK